MRNDLPQGTQSFSEILLQCEFTCQMTPAVDVPQFDIGEHEEVLESWIRLRNGSRSTIASGVFNCRSMSIIAMNEGAFNSFRPVVLAGALPYGAQISCPSDARTISCTSATAPS